MSSAFKTDYNPDVLTCLANLSNDEVFTPPDIANQMLDLLPQSLWQNPEARFLDPVCKSGVFLREIAKRLIDGLATQIPDLQERLDHIFGKQLYGIAITEMTALLSRRSVYCAKSANSPYAICTVFEHEQGNIRYRRLPHRWENGKCQDCGASQEVYDHDNNERENHAYAFIHGDWQRKLFDGEKMKFDVIIGNPPYQLSDGGGTGDSAKPIYHLFIQQAKNLNPNFLLMIIPSRWMKGGKGLSNFREEMIKDTRIKLIYDFENSKDCFEGVNLDGGVCYFLWEKNYFGKVNYYYKPKDGLENYSFRYLKNKITNNVIRDFNQISIIEKSINKEKIIFSELVYSRNPYGFNADLFNDIRNNFISKDKKENFCKIYGVKGKKGGAKRVYGYIPKDMVVKNKQSTNDYKLFFSKAYMTTSTVPPKIILGFPNEICTETFLQIGNFSTEIEAKNCLSYIHTKFFRALLFFNRHSLNISRDSFNLIPQQDFSKPWTDEELYAKYGLTEAEIAFIEKMVRPMVLDDDDDTSD